MRLVSPRPLALVAAVAVSLLSVDAVAETGGAAPPFITLTIESVPDSSAPPAPFQVGDAGFLHLQSSASVVTDGGSSLRLPPGYYLDEPSWFRLDGEVRRLQEQEVRLGAENKSLRDSIGGWQPGWKTLLVSLTVGLAGGVYIGSKI